LKNSKSSSQSSSKQLTASKPLELPSEKSQDNKKCEIHSIEIKKLEIPN
jgi:hypothetical protein